MKRMLGGLMAVVLLAGLLLGCPAYVSPLVEPPVLPESPTAEPPVSPSSPTMPDAVNPPPQPPTNGSTVAFDKPPPDDMNWISPGKVIVTNFYPGARAEYPITIHNGGDTSASFAVTYRYPDHVGDGYVKPIDEVQDWVIVVDTTPLFAPRETRDILVTLEMPENAEVFAAQWEFWISVIDASQSGVVQTELCVRWLVTMR